MALGPGGFGFIEGGDAHGVFVHCTSLTGTGFRSLDGGETVAFSVEDTDRGLEAQDVTRIDEQAPAGRG